MVLNMKIFFIKGAHKVYKTLFISFLLSLVTTLEISFFKPISLLLNNPADFPSSLNPYYSEILQNYLLVILVVGVFFLLALISFKKNSKLIALFLSLAALLWVQSSILTWNYGLLDGRDIPWNQYWYRGAADICMWGMLIILAVKYHHVVSRNFFTLVAYLVLVQVIMFGINHKDDIHKDDIPTLFTQEKATKSQNFVPDVSQKFVFSKDKNIIVFILDSVGDHRFPQIFNLLPELKSKLDGFVRFDDALGSGGYTMFSIPSFMGGRPYLNRTTVVQYRKEVFSSDRSLLRQLHKKGWKTGVFSKFQIFNSDQVLDYITDVKQVGEKEFASEDLSKLKKVCLFASVPQPIKRVLFDKLNLQTIWKDVSPSKASNLRQIKKTSRLPPFPENSDDLKFMNSMLHNITVKSVPRTFKYYHLNGIHAPRTLTKDLQKTKNPSVNDSLIALGKIIIRFIDIIKEAGIYDNSQIYIMTDHSVYSNSSNKKLVEIFSKSFYPMRGRAMFMVKDFGAQGGLKVNHSQLSYFDFPEIAMALSTKPGHVSVQEPIQRFNKKERFFMHSQIWMECTIPQYMN
jgi:hypothetical protein